MKLKLQIVLFTLFSIIVQAELLWYKALIHIKKEAYPKAKEYLEILNAQNANFKAKERNVLLKKLQ